MMQTKTKSFLRPFVGGFALGAAALIGVQVSHPGVPSPIDGPASPIERVG